MEFFWTNERPFIETCKRTFLPSQARSNHARRARSACFGDKRQCRKLFERGAVPLDGYWIGMRYYSREIERIAGSRISG